MYLTLLIILFEWKFVIIKSEHLKFTFFCFIRYKLVNSGGKIFYLYYILSEHYIFQKVLYFFYKKMKNTNISHFRWKYRLISRINKDVCNKIFALIYKNVTLFAENVMFYEEERVVHLKVLSSTTKHYVNTMFLFITYYKVVTWTNVFRENFCEHSCIKRNFICKR